MWEWKMRRESPPKKKMLWRNQSPSLKSKRFRNQRRSISSPWPNLARENRKRSKIASLAQLTLRGRAHLPTVLRCVVANSWICTIAKYSKRLLTGKAAALIRVSDHRYLQKRGELHNELLLHGDEYPAWHQMPCTTPPIVPMPHVHGGPCVQSSNIKIWEWKIHHLWMIFPSINRHFSRGASRHVSSPCHPRVFPLPELIEAQGEQFHQNLSHKNEHQSGVHLSGLHPQKKKTDHIGSFITPTYQ